MQQVRVCYPFHISRWSDWVADDVDIHIMVDFVFGNFMEPCEPALVELHLAVLDVHG